MHVIKRDGTSQAVDFSKIEKLNDYATRGLKVDIALLQSQIKFLFFNGMKTSDIFDAQVKAAAGLINRDNPDMTFVAARYLLCDLYKRVTGEAKYGRLDQVIADGIHDGRYHPRMGQVFDLDVLGQAIVSDRDFQFDYFGLQNVVDRYLMRTLDGKILELPQQFLMRVAMGLALNEDDPTERAIEFYEALSGFRMMSSTPTLFNSGSVRSQLASCFLNTVADQISSDMDEGEDRFASIYGTIEESARLSKFAGGIGSSWTRVRGAGALIKGTNGRSSGTLPYLKVYNDTAVAVNQGGKRKGSFSPYLETWHPDFWNFCELKKEFGDDRLRAHDIFPAAWISDLFMQRVEENGTWSTFEPHLYPELHELYGTEFAVRYEQLEREGKALSSRPAMEVWKHMLANLFETGHPWITFKDETNRRSPQDHVGVVHSSNLCTEITLNTSDTETAVCNLASINVAKHVVNGAIDLELLSRTVSTAVRMLDNVIDLNYYPSERARTANMRHRPVGLGLMGYAEALVAVGLKFDSDEAVAWGDNLMEFISFFALGESSNLAKERGAYSTFEGSKWSRGILPIDTAREQSSVIATESWDALRTEIVAHGIRNSNVMAIAPTATISIIVGTEPCIEPIFELERSEKNISGKFLVLSPCFKYNRPDLLRTAYEIDPSWVIKHAAGRQKWLDQSQSTNVFVKAGTKGRELHAIYFDAWKRGLKTTYYLRSQSDAKLVPMPVYPAPTITSDNYVEGGPGWKIEDGVFNATPVSVKEDAFETSVNLCSIDNPDCEACQ